MGLKNKLAKLAGVPKVVPIGDESFTVYPLTLQDQAVLEEYKAQDTLHHGAALIWLSIRKDDPDLTLDDVLSVLDNKGVVALKPIVDAIVDVNGGNDPKMKELAAAAKPADAPVV